MTEKEVVIAYWQAMESNDFAAASGFFAESFECWWPQTGERIVGCDNFVALNSAFPAEGLWRFTMNSLRAEGEQVVTDVSVTDGVRQDRAITFHTVQHGKIVKQVEYWPDCYEAPAWRAQWVEQLL